MRTKIKEKTDNIKDAFTIVDPIMFQGKRVIIVDDIYQSGVTLHEVATALQPIGADVLGLVATKTIRDPK